MDILPTTPTDMTSVIELLQSSGLPVDDLEESSLQYFIKATHGEGLLAVAGLEPLGQGDALLRSLAVHEQCRGRGVGRLLVEETERSALSLGVRRLFLLTDSAEGFFAAAGYRCIDRTAVPVSLTRTAQFASLCPASAACMHKDLKPAEVRASP